MKQKKRKSIRFKVLIPTAIVVVAISLIMGIASYQGIKGGMVFMGIEEAKMAAKGALDVIDGDMVEGIRAGSEDTVEYQTLLSAMRDAQETFGIAFLYTLYTDGKNVYYGVDADESEGQCEAGEAFEVSYEEMQDVFDGKEYTQDYIDHTEDGDLISAYYPIKNSEGKIVGALGCDYDAVNVVKKLNGTILRTCVIAIICMVAALILVGFIVNNIMINLNAVDRKVYDLVSSDGDLTKKLDVHTNDELENIADNLNLLLNRISEQADIAKEVADGNLTVEVIPLSGYDILGNALKQMVDRNAHTLRGIYQTAQQAKNGASQMASASEALAQGSEEQASAIAEITASISGMADMTKRNAEEAGAAAGMMKEAVLRVNEGNDKMHELMTAMNDINHSAEDISKINKVINDIAFQTNILALNASVEAKHAGLAGKGFSVVAGEVRKLANQCAEAATQTSKLIEISMQKTKTGAELAEETASSLEEITEIVSKGGVMVKDIATASNEQTESITGIDQAVNQVSKVIQTNSSASAQCAATSTELSDQMALVDNMLSAYKL